MKALECLSSTFSTLFKATDTTLSFEATTTYTSLGSTIHLVIDTPVKVGKEFEGLIKLEEEPLVAMYILVQCEVVK